MKKPLIYANKVVSCQFFVISSACSLQNSMKGNILNKSLEICICLQQLQSWSRNFLSLSPTMFFKSSMFQKSSIKTRSSAIEVSIENFVDCAETGSEHAFWSTDTELQIVWFCRCCNYANFILSTHLISIVKSYIKLPFIECSVATVFIVSSKYGDDGATLVYDHFQLLSVYCLQHLTMLPVTFNLQNYLTVYFFQRKIQKF